MLNVKQILGTKCLLMFSISPLLLSRSLNLCVRSLHKWDVTQVGGVGYMFLTLWRSKNNNPFKVTKGGGGVKVIIMYICVRSLFTKQLTKNKKFNLTVALKFSFKYLCLFILFSKMEFYVNLVSFHKHQNLFYQNF